MKKLVFILAVVLTTLQTFAQPVSSMTTFTGNTTGAYIPIIIPVSSTFANRKFPMDSLALIKTIRDTSAVLRALIGSGSSFDTTVLNLTSRFAQKLNTSDTSLLNLSTRLAQKQDVLTAGTNITIVGSTISASGGGGSTTTGNKYYKKDTIQKYIAGNLRTDAASIVRLSNGQLFLAVTQFGNDPQDAGVAELVSYRSNDSGKTWVDKDTVQVKGSAIGNYIPSLFVGKNDTLWCIYLRLTTTTLGQIYRTYSANNGASWSTGTLLYGDGLEYYSPAYDNVLRSKTGRLFYPFCKNLNGTLESALGTYHERYLYSDNNGSTWTLASDIAISPDSLAVEGGFVEAPYIEAGVRVTALYHYWRNRSGNIGYKRSLDNGATWEGSFFANLGAPNSTTHIVYSKEREAFIAAHNRRQNSVGNREMMVVSVNNNMLDFGAAWNDAFVLDSNILTYNYLEPTIFIEGDSLNFIYSYYRKDGVSDSIGLISQRLSFNDLNIKNNYFGKIHINRASNGVDAEYFKITNQRDPLKNYFLIQNQTTGSTLFSPWVKIASDYTGQDMYLNTLASSASGGSLVKFDAIDLNAGGMYSSANRNNPIFTISNFDKPLLYTTTNTTTFRTYNLSGTGSNASALVELQSKSQGFLMPRMTTAEKNAITSPATGLEVYDTDLNQKSYYNGSAWVGIGASTESNTLATFGAGGGNAGDTTAFNTSTIYGSFYNSGTDSLVITSMVGVLQGTSPSVTYKVFYNTVVNNESGATALVTAGNALTSTTTGTTVSSFDATRIPPNVWVWVKTSTVTTKPTYFSLSLIGYKKKQ